LQGYILSTAGDALTSTFFKSGRYIEKAVGVNPCPETSPKKHFNVISQKVLHINN